MIVDGIGLRKLFCRVLETVIYIGFANTVQCSRQSKLALAGLLVYKLKKPL